VYGASVCTWAEVDGEHVTKVGAVIPLSSIENAPNEMEMVWPPMQAATIALPDVARRQTGLLSLKVYWEAHGHPPGPYLVPHFDFHFYTTTSEETTAVDCSDVSEPSELPAGYVLPDVEIPGIGKLIGLCVPEMGMHALLASEMNSDQAFSGTMVVGYYSARPIFLEPMITRDLLLERRTFSLDVPEVTGFGPGVSAPTHFEAEYDTAAQAYRFVLSGFSSAGS
jgi:hypothetical protein